MLKDHFFAKVTCSGTFSRFFSGIIWRRKILPLKGYLITLFFALKVQAEIDELEMVLLKQQDKLTIREKLGYMTSRAVQMPLGITLVLFAFQVNGNPKIETKLFF